MHIMIAEYIKKADILIITAGAGMGIDSGLPDFRGPKDLFWGFYGHRLMSYRKTIPHEGFNILKRMQQLQNIKNSFILTSNVDGQFQKAGFDQNKIWEFHGSIHHLQCNSCRKIVPADEFEIKYNEQTFEAQDPLPQCKICQETMRPNILMFGDYEFNPKRLFDQEENYDMFMQQLKNDDKIIILEFGAGTAVQSTRVKGESIFKDRHLWYSMMVRVNPREHEEPWFYKDFLLEKSEKQFIPLAEGSLSALTSIEKELKLL